VCLIAFGAALRGQEGAQSQASHDVPTYQVDIPLGLIEPDIPLDRPLTEAKIRLGERLFFEPRLSRSGKTSCSTCHDPRTAFAEGRATSVSDNGESQARNAPSLLNAGFNTTMLWDGRFLTLEEQALDPFRSAGDMGITPEQAVTFLAAEEAYVAAFLDAFGEQPSVELLAEALAAYQRSVLSGNSRFDRFFFGGEEEALTPIEKAGWDVFVMKASCINCHDVFSHRVNPLGGRIALFTDFRFHNLGVGYDVGRMGDVGRYRVSQDPRDWGAFKTPSLRNVARTAPYMHDGSLRTLEGVVEFYDRGGVPNPNLSVSMEPQHLNPEDRAALVAFLHTLTDPRYESHSVADMEPGQWIQR
jgi:cytochrome c peroxidase